ncbi:DUF2167 domain-containing protein [Alloalcanivorax dieselolei]|uniref:DUF2167 domain-containing protein n=1 Tax=Alloalcanivorax dieselolei TaxID=285091 RepID=UPI0005A11867|nr:DUF2167 domain-containing protein [Alloalcanivorax dieselolei]
MKYIKVLVVCLALFSANLGFAEEPQLTPEEERYVAEMRRIWDSLDRQQGEISLPNGVAELTVPDSFYYLNPQDSEKVLVEVWGNPPDTAEAVLGMLFPSNATPFDEDAWGVTIEYEEEGYVSDEDADTIDYDALLSQMKEGTSEYSRQRVEEGYESMELVGWASKPFYDKASHKLHWAKEIKFGDQDVNTLNYNIRVLGRKGVLILNFIAGMDQKQIIDSQLDTVLALAEFNKGYRYKDFDPSIDQMAAYGIGALVAGKVITKTGFLAAALVFLKKFGVLIVVGAGAMLGRLFKRRKT